MSHHGDRRRGGDRRARPTTLMSSLLGRGRRRGFRRAGEERNQYLDHVSARVVLLVVAVMTLSALDAVCTLFHVAGGGSEINPLMRFFLLRGVVVFLAVKGIMTIAGLIVLAAHENFRFSLPSLYVAVCGYGAVTIYHGCLIG